MPDLIYSDMLEGPDGKRINKPLPSKSEEGEFLYAFRFLQVPANINYNISLKERSALMITAGASLDILLHAYGITKIKVEGEPLQVTKTQPEDKYYHRINYSTYFSVGYQYQLNKKISIKANPYYSINIRYMDKNVGYRARYYNYGVGLGVYYNL
jgi:predicted glycosyltransferase